jgi:NitT/TauT family transport system substrate-binding protein
MNRFHHRKGYELSRKRSKVAYLMHALSDSSRPREYVAIPKTSSLLSSGVVSTAGKNLRSLAFARDDSRMRVATTQSLLGKHGVARIVGLALLLLFFPGGLNAEEPLRAGTIFSATQAPLWAAKEGRFFEKYGIKNLEVIQFSGGQPVTRALIGGDIQISTTGGAAVVNASLQRADTVVIARTVGVFPYTLYVSKDIRDTAELKGKKLAVSTVGGSGYVAMQYALRKLGLDPDKDVAMLQVGDFGTRLASLASGTVQGTLLLPPFTLRARELGLRPLYDLVGSGIQYPINQIATRQSFIKSQRETVKNFLKGLVAGLARFRTDRELGVKVLGQNLRETDAKILQETYEFWLKVFPKIPNPGPEDATVFLEFMQVKEQHDWKDFVDPSLMAELERDGFLSSVYK